MCPKVTDFVKKAINLPTLNANHSIRFLELATYIISPIKEFNPEQIRQIRNNAGMTQTVFANYMGVSKKTVEAWECGRTHPTGPAFRLLDILNEGKEKNLSFVEVV